jgi:hypothetical protein
LPGVAVIWDQRAFIDSGFARFVLRRGPRAGQPTLTAAVQACVEFARVRCRGTLATRASRRGWNMTELVPNSRRSGPGSCSTASWSRSAWAARVRPVAVAHIAGPGDAAGRESVAYEVMETSMLLTVRERGAAARRAVQ